MTANPKPLRIGLVGGIGSGKSEVSRLLVEAGAQLVSGDELGHQALRDPAIRATVVSNWGETLLGDDGEIVRSRLGTIVFNDPEQRRRLESIVHPWIKAAIARALHAASTAPGVRLIVLDAAIMLEAGWDGELDGLLFVDTPRELRLQRIAATRGWSEKEVARREQAQLSLDAKAQRAQYRVRNDGTKAELRTHVDTLLRQWGLT